MNQKTRTIVIFAVVEFIVIVAAMAWWLTRN
jgi:hypothetical protein